MNVSIEYMYGDGANYKQYSILVFPNKTDLSLELIKKQINLSLLNGEYFIPSLWGIPKLHKYEYDHEIDHEIHELLEIKNTNEILNFEKDIVDLLQEIKSRLN